VSDTKLAFALTIWVAVSIVEASSACADDAIVTASETSVRTAPSRVAPAPDAAAQPDATSSAAPAHPRLGVEAPREQPTNTVERKWYASEMALSYAPAALLIAEGAGTNSPRAASVGWLGVLLVPPVIHLGHGNGGAALLSVGTRVLFLATLVALVDDCLQIPLFGGEPTTSHSGKCDALAAASFSEMIALPVIDFALASTVVQKEQPRHSFAFVPRGSAGALSLSFAGTF
jgi:hypothetical protein